MDRIQRTRKDLVIRIQVLEDLEKLYNQAPDSVKLILPVDLGNKRQELLQQDLEEQTFHKEVLEPVPLLLQGLQIHLGSKINHKVSVKTNHLQVSPISHHQMKEGFWVAQRHSNLTNNKHLLQLADKLLMEAGWSQTYKGNQLSFKPLVLLNNNQTTASFLEILLPKAL